MLQMLLGGANKIIKLKGARVEKRTRNRQEIDKKEE
jgi:hypothetical protein